MGTASRGLVCEDDHPRISWNKLWFIIDIDDDEDDDALS